MKIVHLCLGCFFPDNYSYQENMLPKFHKKLGYDVEVIASLATFDENGKASFLREASIYQNEYDIKVTRLNFKKPKKIYRKFKRYIGTYDALKKSNPDILFIHGCQFMDMDAVVKYLEENKNIQVFVDNHADFSNSGKNWLSRFFLHKMIWRHTAHMVEPYTEKFYGVLPARVDWLVDMYRLPKAKCELLVMGADDDEIKRVEQSSVRKKIRNEYSVTDNDKLLVTGGKIDKHKLQILTLIKTIHNMHDENIKLIVFGSIDKEIQSQFEKLCDGKHVHYVGWLSKSESYDLFSAADVVIFPGRHSVYWEQVVAMGIPMICKYWEGTTHIDIGGNVEFLLNDSEIEMDKVLQNVFSNYNEYLQNAKKATRKNFWYGLIARKSINI